jgi:hypothetical protein
VQDLCQADLYALVRQQDSDCSRSSDSTRLSYYLPCSGDVDADSEGRKE